MGQSDSNGLQNTGIEVKSSGHFYDNGFLAVVAHSVSFMGRSDPNRYKKRNDARMRHIQHMTRARSKVKVTLMKNCILNGAVHNSLFLGRQGSNRHLKTIRTTLGCVTFNKRPDQRRTLMTRI